MPHKASQESLGFHFSLLVDPRVQRTQAHSLHDILMIALCALLCGAESFVEFERFGEAKRDWLARFLKLPNGIPSHDTFGRVFALLDPRQFSACFRNWTCRLRQSFAAEIDSLRSPCGLPAAVCLAALGCRP